MPRITIEFCKEDELLVYDKDAADCGPTTYKGLPFPSVVCKLQDGRYQTVTLGVLTSELTKTT